MDWDVFRAEGLAKALTDAGHEVSERTVNRWKAGTHRPTRAQLRAIVELVADTKEEAAPGWERLEVMLEAVRLKLNVTDAELDQAEADLLTARRLGGSGKRRPRGTGGAPGGSGAGVGP